MTLRRRGVAFQRTGKRQHLLAVTEAGFGDLQPFNRVIRKLLKERTEAKYAPSIEVMRM